MTESVYDKEGNVIEQIDAKGNSTFMVYDAQNRRRTVTDRLSGVTTYALNAGSRLTALTDAESQTTSYTYNARGEKTEEQYPDHTSGPKQAGFRFLDRISAPNKNFFSPSPSTGPGHRQFFHVKRFPGPVGGEGVGG